MGFALNDAWAGDEKEPARSRPNLNIVEFE